MPVVHWATRGTATVKLTIPRNPPEVVKKPLPGCFVKKEANVKHFIEKYIDPSADRNKYERSDYLFYCCVSDFREVVTKAVIKYEKPSWVLGLATQKTKTCTVKHPLIITFDGHFFLCCDSEDLGKESKFLAECSKEVRIDQDLGTRKKFFGLGIDKNYLMFISFETQQLQNHMYAVNDRRIFNKLLETGPLLLDDKKTIVGCYRKLPEGNKRIEINIFGNQDPAPGHQGETVADSWPSEAPERDRLPDHALPGPSRDNQQSENQDLATVYFLYDQLIVETIKYLDEYITRSGSLAELKNRFRGSLSKLTENKRETIDDVQKLVDALENLGVIGAGNVKLLKLLSKELGLNELKHKIENFEAVCQQKVTKCLVCLKVMLSLSGDKVALLDEAVLSIYGINPEELENLQPLQEIRAKIKALFGGSVVFILEIASLSSLKRLWQSYKDGSLKGKLKKGFNEMGKLKTLSQGEEIDLEVTIDEEEYREALWDLIQLEVKGESMMSTKRRQRRHSVSCERDGPEELTVGDAALKNTKSRRRHSAPAVCCKGDLSEDKLQRDVTQRRTEVTRPATKKEKPESEMKRDDELERFLYRLDRSECKQTSLNLNRNYITDDELMRLSAALATKECKLTTLDLSRNRISDDGLKYLSDALATNQCKLTTLDLSWNQISDDGLKYLSHGLAKNQCKLTTLNISGNLIHDDGLKYLSDALKTNQCKLTTLNVSGNQIHDHGLKYLSDALATKECKLTTLDISFNQINDDRLKYLSDTLATNQCKLTTLNISGNLIHDVGLKYFSDALATKECKLTTLDLSRNEIRDEGLKYLSDALATNQCKLTTLKISGNLIHRDGLKYLSVALAKNQCKLTTLDLSWIRIGNEGLKYLSYALVTNQCKLTTLDIRKNQISDEGLKYLSHALATNLCKLTTLNISDNSIHDDGLKYLSDALATNQCKLTTLNFSGNQIHDDGLKYFSDTLATKECKLTTLDISFNQISDDRLKYLSDTLATNQCKLITLNISGNLIHHDGLKYLSDALATKECKLTTLDLSRTQIRDEGLKYLSDALATNQWKLTTLNISGNLIHDDGLKYLIDVLITNQCKLTTLDLRGNRISDEGLKYLSDATATKEGKLSTLDIIGDRRRDQNGIPDVSILYSPNGERWVEKDLIPLLELENDFRCKVIEFRDFQADEMFDEDVFFYKSRKNLVVVSEDFLYCSYQGKELHMALELLQRRWSKSFIVINLGGVHQIRLPEVLWKVPSLNLRNPKETMTWRNWLVKEINEEAEKTSERDKQHLEDVQFPAIPPPATNLDSYLVV